MPPTHPSVDQALLQHILDALPVAIWVAAPDGTLLFNNPAARAIWQGELWVGMDGYGEYKAWRADTGEAIAAEDWAMTRALRQGETTVDEAIDIQCFDGSRKTVLHSGLPVRDARGDMLCAIALNQDITGLHAMQTRLEDDRRRMETLAIESLSIQEAERKRLSRELHDEVGQSLTALKIALGTLNRNCRDDACEPGLGLAIGIADDLIETVRDISRRLRPSQLDDLGLAAALRWHLDKTPVAEGLDIAFEENIGHDRLPTETELCGFRVVQEALSNILRHARASRVEIELRRDDGRLELAIGDDGIGFDLDLIWHQPPHRRSLGLLGMKERAAALGGHFQIDSLPGRGTRILVSLPL